MVLQSIIGLCSKEKYNIDELRREDDDRYDNGENGNKDGNDYKIAASRSGYYGPIFDLITTPQSCGGGSGGDGDGDMSMAHYI